MSRASLLQPFTVLLLVLLAGCAGQPQPLPDTPHRTQLIGQIVAKSGMVRTLDSLQQAPPAKPLPSVDELIAERKQLMGFLLPDAYWALYRDNLEQFKLEMAEVKVKSLTEYKRLYRTQLVKASDSQLETLATAQDMEATPVFKKVLGSDMDITLLYFDMVRVETVVAVQRHLKRMAQMDVQYDVCSRYKACWNPR